MGLTDKGYSRRTFEEIVNAKIEKAKELFGEDINTDENTALGKYIHINAYDQYVVEELAEQIYYSIFPQTASGASLDRLAWSVNLKRNPATRSCYTVRVYGEQGATVELGFLVGTESGINFWNTTNGAVINQQDTDGYYCDIIVECVEAGIDGNVSPSDINQIVETSAEIESVKGLECIELGTEEESDVDFRKRFGLARAGAGGSTADAIVAALTTISGVRGAYVEANESTAENTAYGTPPKTITCFVDIPNKMLAAKTQEIGETIFDKKPIGIGTNGEQKVTVSYGGLKDYIVSFEQAPTVGVYLNITLVTNTEFEDTGLDDIKIKLSEFINGLGIGESLIVTKLYSQIFSINGVVSALIEAATVPVMSWSSEPIEVEPYQCCSLTKLIINGETV